MSAGSSATGAKTAPAKGNRAELLVSVVLAVIGIFVLVDALSLTGKLDKE